MHIGSHTVRGLSPVLTLKDPVADNEVYFNNNNRDRVLEAVRIL